jgi:hypothetical protein
MTRVWLAWFLMGALGLASYDVYQTRTSGTRPVHVHPMDGGNGMPPH